jgi:hypothetical protein
MDITIFYFMNYKHDIFLINLENLFLYYLSNLKLNYLVLKLYTLDYCYIAIV